MHTWLVVLTCCAACCAHAADVYPNKPIRIIITVAPGGGADITARAVGQKLSEAWGQQVVVDNRPGGNGIVGMDIAAHASPDGYTIVEGTIGPVAVNPSLYSKLPYDPVNDFAPIARAVTALNMLVVYPSLPAHSVKELIAYAKAYPNKLNYAEIGVGSAMHMGMEQFKFMTKTEINRVSYRGTAPAISDVVAGTVDLMFTGPPSAKSMSEGGKLKVLAVASPDRIVLLPDVPTVAEAGVPGYTMASWFGLLAPAKTSTTIVERLSAETKTAVNNQVFKDRMKSVGLEIDGGTPEAMLETMQSDTQRWAELIKATGITIPQ